MIPPTPTGSYDTKGRGYTKLLCIFVFPKQDIRQDGQRSQHIFWRGKERRI